MGFHQAASNHFMLLQLATLGELAVQRGMYPLPDVVKRSSIWIPPSPQTQGFSVSPSSWNSALVRVAWENESSFFLRRNRLCDYPLAGFAWSKRKDRFCCFIWEMGDKATSWIQLHFFTVHQNKSNWTFSDWMRSNGIDFYSSLIEKKLLK